MNLSNAQTFVLEQVEGERDMMAVVATALFARVTFAEKKWLAKHDGARQHVIDETEERLGLEVRKGGEMAAAIAKLEATALKNCDWRRGGVEAEIRAAAAELRAIARPMVESKRHTVYEPVKLLRYIGGAILLNTDRLREGQPWHECRVTVDVTTSGPGDKLPRNSALKTTEEQ